MLSKNLDQKFKIDNKKYKLNVSLKHQIFEFLAVMGRLKLKKNWSFFLFKFFISYQKILYQFIKLFLNFK